MKKNCFFLILNRKGQVAIFIALIFQVLFLFFAMIINVGLLVHHKINLQNSVDLAAYYGAMKQAETLNAVGHINYQIRQSWKLLAWRYRQLGTAGDYNLHPYSKPTREVKDIYLDHFPMGLTGNQKDYYDAPAFCITYVPFGPMPGNESTCMQQSDLQTIKLFTPPKELAGFNAINKVIRQTTEVALTAAVKRCEYIGQFNYVILAEFMAAFNIDQAERKQLINMLSRGLSAKQDDFRDISGDFVSEGIRKTLEKNLTEANRVSLNNGGKMEIFNSLGSPDCNDVGQAKTDPAKWLSEVKIQPAFIYTDSICSKEKVQPIAKELGPKPEVNLPTHSDGVLKDDIAYLAPMTQPMEAPYNSSLGYEKNPWCMAYVGVSAQTAPSIPFAPMGGVTLKARSFAKPFGGKIGPWYYGQWPRGSDQSSGGKRTDPLLPWRVGDKSNQADPRDPTRAANYSRYVGDKAGMKSQFVQGQWARAIYNISSDWSQKVPNPETDNSLPPGWKKGDEPNFYHWHHLGQTFDKEKSGDILAWNKTLNSPPRMRDLELAAILPDQFDLTYYSIEPDFYHNYYLKLSQDYVKKVPGFDYTIRPDLGSRLGDKNLEVFSVRDQYKVVDRIKTDNPQLKEAKVDFETKLMYVAKEVSQVLTSWVGKDLMDYTLDKEKFGKCDTPAGDEKLGPTSGDCLTGGRTGYSVKMVSSDYLQAQDLEVGGENTGGGALLNPPPSDF